MSVRRPLSFWLFEVDSFWLLEDVAVTLVGSIFCRWLLGGGNFASLTICRRLVAFGRSLAFAVAHALAGDSLARSTSTNCHALRSDGLLHNATHAKPQTAAATKCRS